MFWSEQYQKYDNNINTWVKPKIGFFFFLITVTGATVIYQNQEKAY